MVPEAKREPASQQRVQGLVEPCFVHLALNMAGQQLLLPHLSRVSTFQVPAIARSRGAM